MICSAGDKLKHIAAVSLCVFGAMLIFAGCTSPLYPHYTCLDSSMFLITARGITEGKIAYIDLFDHKGPIFFWLEAIGYAIGGRTGVWLLECVLAVLDVLLIEKICGRLKAKALLPVLASASLFFYLFMHGNLTEEFSMPLILAAVWMSVSFFAGDSVRHPPLAAFAYGVIIGCLAFIRLNNAVGVCVLVICIGVILIKEKQWGNILANFLMGLAGIAVVAIPVCAYFYAHSALYEMLYATFLHNFVYAKNSSHAAILSKYIINFAFMYAPGVYVACVFAAKSRSGNKRLYLPLLAATAVTYAMLLYSNVYAHYFMLGLPFFAIAAAVQFPDLEIKNILSTIKRRSDAACLGVIVFAFFCLSLYSAAAPIYKSYLSNIASDQYSQIAESMECVPEDERDSVIGFGVLADFYVHADILPCYKYYTLQRWMTTENRDVYGQFVDYVLNEHPLWIVTKTDETDSTMLQILSDEYILKTQDDYCKYYRLR